ncbi:MAG: ROK family protein [Candidatus Omnitrophota bacterium]|nr:ROK family protein [Candidatus Omnitrophota bacterium]
MPMTDNVFIGIDVGGTKIAAALVNENGKVLARGKKPTPKNAAGKGVLSVIKKMLNALARDAGVPLSDARGIGIGIPGLVGPNNQDILATPNIRLAGFPLWKNLRKIFNGPIAINNDVNVGLLGEQWLGAARDAKDVLGLFPGTGVGGGIIINGKLVTGTRGAASEFGHMIMALNGPPCSCGNRGCLEALASRWSIERDIRAAVRKGRKTVITDLTGGDLSAIKSRVLKQALKAKDPLARDVVSKAADALGAACVSLNHIFNPEMIVLGGGVIEACGNFILPRVRKAVDADPFFSKDINRCRVVESQLGDDAVILGAVALIRQELKLAPSKKGNNTPAVVFISPRAVSVNGTKHAADFYIRTDGKAKFRERKFLKSPSAAAKLDAGELKKICKKKPSLLIIGTRPRSKFQITIQGRAFLKKDGVDHRILPTDQAIRLYNEADCKKALVLRLKD